MLIQFLTRELKKGDVYLTAELAGADMTSDLVGVVVCTGYRVVEETILNGQAIKAEKPPLDNVIVSLEMIYKSFLSLIILVKDNPILFVLLQHLKPRFNFKFNRSTIKVETSH